ncbi:MAG TPA: rod shape-determining protein MreC [Bryobacteraceae bacterium]|nr:rod shape-determining protein MreC [Bryobacteraceae bacterium]
MESLLNRYRNITVLLLVIFAQLVLVAVQVKNDQDVRMIRVWSVTAVTPLARALEGVRSGTVGVVENYVLLKNADAENRRLKSQLDQLKMENQFLRQQLATADRAKALSLFQTRTPSKTLAARVIATGAGAGTNSKVVFVDTGSTAGVQKGMGVVTPDGIVGKVIASYPTASMVMLATDPDFAAGVVSQKHQVKGVLKGQGYAECKVDFVPNEEKVDVGEVFYTSGDDRIFPKGFPAAIVRVVRPGSEFKEILVDPIGLEHGAEEVLILLEGVSQAIPEVQAAGGPVYLAPPPPGEPVAAPAEPGSTAASGTEADRLLERYRQIGAAQGHKFGEGLPGSKPPDFNLKVPPAGAPGATASGSAQAPLAVPGATGTTGAGQRPAAPPTAVPKQSSPPATTLPARQSPPPAPKAAEPSAPPQ